MQKSAGRYIMECEFEIDQKLTGTEYMIALKHYNNKVQSAIQTLEMYKRQRNNS